jgi:flagellar basal body rod protein FlgG
MEQVSNNMANLNTLGFKGRRVPFENYMKDPGLLGDGYTKLGEVKVDFGNGAIVRDGVNSHLALRGEGFFAVESSNGETLLQRSGSFQFDSNGVLVNSMGERVMGRYGAIQLNDLEQQITVASDGRVLDEQGMELGQLMVVNSDELEPLDNSRWRPGEIQNLTGSVTIEQGALEGSNVDAFRTMIDLMQTTRYMEMYQKAIQTSDQMDSELNQLTRRT